MGKTSNHKDITSVVIQGETFSNDPTICNDPSILKENLIAVGYTELSESTPIVGEDGVLRFEFTAGVKGFNNTLTENNIHINIAY